LSCLIFSLGGKQVKSRLSVFVFSILFLSFVIVNLCARVDRENMLFDDLGMFGGRHEVLDKARAMETYLEMRENLIRKLEELKIGPEASWDMGSIKSYESVLSQVENALRPIKVGEAALRVAIGKDSWDVIKDLDTNKIGAGSLVGYGALLKVAKVAGDRVEEAINRSFGDFLSDILYGGVSKFKRTVRYVVDKINRRDGKAFDCEEVLAWQKTLNKTFNGLVKRARKAGMIGQRDRVMRSSVEEEVTDDTWKWQRDLYEREFRSVAERIDEYLKYYREKHDNESQIIVYSTHIRDWLLGYIDNCLSQTKTHKDLGSGANLNALINLKESLDNNFSILINYLDTSSSTRKNKESTRDAVNPYSRINRGGYAGGYNYDSEDYDEDEY